MAEAAEGRVAGGVQGEDVGAGEEGGMDALVVLEDCGPWCGPRCG